MDTRETYSWMINQFIDETEHMIKLIRKQQEKLKYEARQVAKAGS